MIVWWTTVALAGSVYVNGVNVDSLRDQTFEDVTVTIDANGDVRIAAPAYKIEVVDPKGAPPPVSPGPPPVRPATTTSSYPPPPPVQPVTNAGSGSPPPVQASVGSPPASGITRGKYWLVTEDAGSRGHTIDVYVNGTHVQQVRSGESQRIIDLAPWLKRGINDIHVQSESASASGGPLYVYVGQGSNASGTIVLDAPDVQYGLGASRRGALAKDFKLNVQ